MARVFPVEYPGRELANIKLHRTALRAAAEFGVSQKKEEDEEQCVCFSTMRP